MAEHYNDSNYHHFITQDECVESTGPVVEPVTLVEAKLHLRVDFTDDDTLIANQIKAIRQWMERTLNTAMVERTFTANLPCFYESVHFPFKPLLSVKTVKYYNDESPTVLTTLADSTTSPVTTTEVYRVNVEKGYLYRAYGETWPATAVRHDAVQITFSSGYTSAQSPIASTVPEALKASLLLLLGDLYENRESSTPLKIEQLPTAKMLMQAYRYYQ